jgi:hypothetical protein
MSCAQIAAFLVFFILAGAFCFPSRSSADFYSGNELLAKCTGSAVDQMFCTGYVIAIADALDHDLPVFGFKACIPRGVTIKQIIDAAVSSLSRGISARHLAASSLVAEAIAKIFPCR